MRAYSWRGLEGGGVGELGAVVGLATGWQKLALTGLPDKRRINRHIPQATALCVIVLAMLCGRSKVSEFVRFAQGLTQEQKKLIGFPRLKRSRQICKAPSRKTSTPALRENFGRRPSLASRILTNPFDASLAS